ncbi:CheR family methyltransferase [Paracraurococcus lichenis]|uniref:Chemotaxis protein methyltransferase n=1 Tax=Paracraurococcus lichenis TaxID=3064888 RepID=A0ABT9E698_9PROT|nr:protein-glutamate O-methyltransferase CheR [Paracraurococcus sp. LOR1-02]MDO9711692.1 protein-glutamate O-methyltransferase CheR [Paracraurococcus sp. LOR1-02]
MSQSAPAVQAGEFARFQEMFYQKTGIVFGESKRYFVDRRLTERMSATGSKSFEDYLMLLRFRDPNAEELQNLINVMTVNETYFYREKYQFQCLSEALLPQLVQGRRRGDPLQIWSMPCSTGEEPYSIAIHLLESWPEVDHWDVRILASDIDTRVLEQARAGIYEARSLQHLTEDLVRRYFTPTRDGNWRIIANLRRSIEFRRANITEVADVQQYRDIDVIFCRNLLIYFDEASRRRATEALFDSLRPGGFICLGHSESMSRMSSLFEARKFPDAIVYQRPF